MTYLRTKASVFLKAGSNVLLPPACSLCTKRVSDPHGLCPPCWSRLDFITNPCCSLCGLPFAYDINAESLCAGCLYHKPDFDMARAALYYSDSSRKLILAYKHGDRLDLSHLFQKWMRTMGEDVLQGADIIALVPLHWRRLLLRRYNQAAFLAMHWARDAGTVYHPDLLQRARFTASQGRLSFRDRKRNVQGAFRVKPSLEQAIIGKTIVLMDDVYTTGATLNACAKVLKENGANSVKALTLARVVME